MKSYVSLILMLSLAGMVFGHDEGAAPTTVIKLSSGSVKIIGEPVVKEYPPVRAVVVMEKASSYTPEGGYTVDQAGVNKAYTLMMQGGFGKLVKWSSETGVKPAGPPFALYFEDPTTTEPVKLTAKVAYPVQGEVKVTEYVVVEEVPAMSAVTLQYEGPYEESNNAWMRVIEWTKVQGYEMAGPPVEVYLKGPMDVKESTHYLTEIRVPVRKIIVKPVEGSATK